MDAVGHQERFNAQSKRGLLDFFRFWNTSLSYEYQPKSGACQKNTVHGKFYPVFGWLQFAKTTGTCKSYNGKLTGQGWQWVTKTRELELQFNLCVDTTGKVPYWTEMKGNDKGNEFQRGAVFNSYTAGAPAPSFFVLPSSCNKDADEVDA